MTVRHRHAISRAAAFACRAARARRPRSRSAPADGRSTARPRPEDRPAASSCHRLAAERIVPRPVADRSWCRARVPTARADRKSSSRPRSLARRAVRGDIHRQTFREVVGRDIEHESIERDELAEVNRPRRVAATLVLGLGHEEAGPPPLDAPGLVFVHEERPLASRADRRAASPADRAGCAPEPRAARARRRATPRVAAGSATALR